ncbi:MAG: hypothetical protein ABGX16_00190 [Pirellulales bacterium]
MTRALPDSDKQLAARQQVALVEGSALHMSSETRALLRSRLRIVAMLLFVGFLAYSIVITGID